MTGLGAVLLALVVVVGDGDDACRELGEARSAARNQRLDAAAYRSVGDEAAAAGDVAAAKVAYREALRRDHADGASRARLAAICREPERQGPATSAREVTALQFDEGLRRMARGDRAGAVTAFAAVRARDGDPAAALLEGICEFELGHDRRAVPLLEQAQDTHSLAGTASFFLAVIALHDGQSDRASSLLASAAANDQRLAGNARALDRLFRRDGRLKVSALTEAGYDSNVALTPDGTAIVGGAEDGSVTGLVGLFVRPREATGLYGRLVGQYRKQFRIDAYDLGSLAAALGARLGGGGRANFLAAEYGYDLMTLGEVLYLSAHRLTGSAVFVRGPYSILGTLSTRYASFFTDVAAAYTGWRHEAQVEFDAQVVPAVELGVGFRGARDGTREASLSLIEGGPVATLRWWPRDNARIIGEARWSSRAYDALDTELSARRTDVYVDGTVAAELDVSDAFTIRLTGTARRARSNLPDFEYSKLVVGAGLVYSAAVVR